MTLTPNEVKSVRSRLGISTEKMGKLLGISGRTIRNWEKGITSPPHRLAVIMCRLAQEPFERAYGDGTGQDRFTSVVIVSPSHEGTFEP